MSAPNLVLIHPVDITIFHRTNETVELMMLLDEKGSLQLVQFILRGT